MSAKALAEQDPRRQIPAGPADSAHVIWIAAVVGWSLPICNRFSDEIMGLN